MVVNTKPGTTVPVRIVRDRQERTLSVTVDELDLEAESAVARGGDRPDDPAQETSSGFGITLQNVTPEIARRLRLEDRRGAVITDIEQGSPAARAGLQPGDVIVRVGRQAVESAPKLSGNWPAFLGWDGLPAHPSRRPGNVRDGDEGQGISLRAHGLQATGQSRSGFVGPGLAASRPGAFSFCAAMPIICRPLPGTETP